MKNRVLTAMLGAGLLAGSTAVLAQAQDSGWYLGAGIGQSKAKDACEGAATCNNTDTAFKLFGGYQFNRNFAAELAYNDLGKSTASGVVSGVAIDAKFEATALELVGIASWPIDRFALYGKGGAYYGELKSSGTGTFGGRTVSVSLSDNTTDLTFGIGARYDFTRNVAVRAEWQRYKGVGGDNTGKSDIDVLGVGLLYRF